MPQHHMVEMMNTKDLEACTEEVAAKILRMFLGHRSHYAKGLGHSVLPESSKFPRVSNEVYECFAKKNAQNRKTIKYYQNRL